MQLFPRTQRTRSVAAHPILSGRFQIEPLEPRIVFAVIPIAGEIGNGSSWIDGNIYQITADARVAAGSLLTIEAGAIIKFNDFVGIDLLIEGTVNANGTAAKPILFTSLRDDTGLDGVLGTADDNDTNLNGPTNAGAGEWNQIHVATGGRANLTNVDIRSAGDVFGGVVASLFVNGGNVSLTNSTIQKSEQAGVRIVGADPTLTGNTFRDNFGAAVSMDLASNPAISGVTLTNNAVNGLLVDAGTISGARVWDDIDIVYRLSGDITIAQGATLTIAPGQEIKARDFLSDELIVNGTLLARGTPAQPILFASFRDDRGFDNLLNTADDRDTNNNGATSAGAGEWNGLVFNASSTGNILENVEVRSGGDFAVAAAIIVNGAPLTFSSSIVRDSETHGIRINGSNPILSNNAFRGNFGAAVSMDLTSNPAISGVTVTGNAINGLLVDAGTITGAGVWDDSDIVYRLNGDVTIAQGATLTIAPGQEIKARDFAGDDIIVNGTLLARGTAAQPILFASFRDDRGFDNLLNTADDHDTNNNGATSAGAGEWNGLVFNASSTGNILENVEVRSAGDFAVPAAIIINSAPLTFSSSIVRDSETHGVRINASNPTLTNNIYRGNFGGAISMDLASDPVIAGVTASNNAVNGLIVDSGSITGSRRWDDPDIVYRLNGDVTVAQGATLTIAPGQIIKARDFAGDEIVINGTLVADGTPAQKILFASFRDDRGFDNLLNTADDSDTNNNGATAAGAGEWNGLVFNAGSSGNVLNNVEVRSAGDFGVAGAIIVDGAPLALSNSTIGDSETFGIRIVGANPVLTNNRITGSFGGAISMDLASNPAIAGITLTSNAVNGVAVDAGTISGSQVWDDAEIVYRLSGDVTIAAGATLTIAAGQIIKARDFAGDEIIVNGTLLAAGTAPRPIVFASFRDDSSGGDTNNNGVSSAGAGEWNGLVFNTGSSGSILNHVDVRSAGDFGVAGAILVSGGSATVTNSVVTLSETNALAGRNGGVLMASGNVIRDNLDAAIRAETGAQISAFNNTIDGNLRGLSAAGSGTLVTLTNNLITNHVRSGILNAGATINASFNLLFNPTASGGEYEGLPSQTGQNGNISANPQYFNRASKQFQLRAGSPAIDSASSEGAPANDFTDNLRFDDPNVLNLGSGAQVFFDRGAYERQEVSVSDVDLRGMSVSGPSTGLQGQNITVNWTVENLGPRALLGSWFDAIYLSDDAVFTPDDLFLGDAQHTGDLPAGASYAGSKQVTLPGVLPDDYYFIVRANSRGEVFEGIALLNNAVASSQTIAMDLPVLTLGAPLTGQLPQTGSVLFYKINAPNGADLSVNLDGPGGATNELFLSFGELPSRQSFDERGNRPNSADQSISVADTQAGQYYAMVFGANLTAPETFTISASLAGFGITEVSPVRGSNTGEVTLTIRGSQFDANSQPRLIDSANQTLTPTRVIFSDSGQISATFNLAGRPTGAADVQVVNSGNVVTTLPDAVNIVSGKQGQLVTNLIAPSRVRLGRDFTLFIELKNTGDTDLLAPVLELEGLGFSTLSFRADMAQSASALTLLGANDTAPAGVLPPGAEVRIPIYGRATANGDERFTLRVGNYPATPIDYAAIEALVRPANIPDAEWDPLYAEAQAQIGTQWSGYVQRLAEDATLLPASKGSPFSLEDVFSLEIDRARASLNTSVSGMLFLGDNTRPLADVEVILVDRLTGEGVTTSTLNDGTFLLPEVEPGTYRVSFGGFVSATPVDVTVAAADVNGLSVLVEPGGVIRGGVLLGAGGAPLRDIPVIAMNTQGDLFTSQTAADGTYQLDSLPAGDYTVSAGGGALSRAEVSVNGLERGEQEAHVNFALAPASTLQGTVTGPGGAISGALVSAIGADNQAFSATTGANGEFTINGLPGQSYTLVSFFGGLVSQEQANVNVASGTTVSGLALALAAAGGIRGTITAPGGVPVPFAPLVITTSDGREFFAQTESDGDYEVGDLPAGTFTVTPIDTAFMSVSTTAMVTSGGFTDLNLQLTPLGSVSGTVSNSTNGQPLRGVTVFVVDTLGVHGSDVTDATGAYSVPNLDDGSYSIVVGNIGTPGVARFDVILSDATPEASRNFAVAVAGVITGTVFGPDGSAPQAGAIVTLSQQGDAILRQPVNADGTYSIVVLSDGAYQVEATAVSLSYPVVSVNVSGGGTFNANNFLPGVRALNGIVQNAANSQPISGASILIEKTSPTVASREVATVLSTSNGAFDFGALADGAYRLTISAAGFGTVIQNFTVAGGNPTPLTVGLGPEGLMSGTVRDSQTAALLANATLLLVSQTNPSLSLTTVADASGAYRLEKVPPGAYDLIVLPGDAVHQSIARVVTIAAGENVLDAQLPAANIQVSGQINGGGGPLRDALVFALDASGRYRASVFTDAGGNYLFTTLAPGNYSLVAAPDLFAAAAPLNVSVASGQTVGNNNFTLTPAALSDPSDEEHPAPLVAAAPGGISGYITSLLRTPERLEREPTSDTLSGRLDPVNCPEESRNASRLVRDIPRHFAEWQEATSEVRWSSAREFASIGLQLANTIGKFVLVVRAVAADAALAATSATFQTVFQLLPGYLTDLANSYFRVKENIAKPELDASKATEFGIEIADKSLSIVNGTLKAAREEAGKLLKGTGSFAPNPTKLEQLGRFVKGLDAIFTAYQTLTDSLDAYNSLVAQVQRVQLAHDAYSTAVADANAAIHFLDMCKESESRSPKPIPPPMTTVVATSSPTQIRSSFDPNDKHGPAGFGSGGFIQPGVLSYEVEFENDPVFAQIAAQIVDVKDTLDVDLDLATFEFTSFGFSNRIFAVPAGLTHFETTIDLRPDGIDLLVPVVMDLNSATREVRVTFSTLDPLTMQAPEGFEGFLPVNNASHAGEGFFTYVVQPKSGLSTGSAITNQAQIVFDDNAPINTPTTLHTIDIDVPTSTVATLPANTNEPTFAISWSGDDGAGSAIATYDLFVIDNGGPATLFLDDTTLTTTTFEGQRGHTYAFFTVARDNVGLVEAAPGAPDAAISVDQGQPISFDAKNPLTFTDANGDAVIVKIKGAGSGQAILRNGQNSGADLASLFLSATTSKTSVSISAGKTGATSLESVTVEGGLKALKLAAGVVLGAENGGVVEISGALGSFTTKEMFSGAFSAAGVGKFVAGGLDQVVLSIGAGATLATSKDLKKSGLGTLQIAADVTNTVLTALGNVGKVTIGGAFTDSMLVAGIDAGADRIPLTADDTYHRHASVQALTVKDAFLRSSVTAGIAPGADAAWGGPDDVLGTALSGFSKDGKLGKIVIGIASVVAGSGSPFGSPATASHLNVIQAPALAGIQIGKTRERGFDTAIWLDANRNGTEETDEVLIRTL